MILGKKIRILLAVLLVGSTASCIRSSQYGYLQSAEKIMDSDPSVAMVILDSVNSASLKGEERALYAMLRTLADYKCYVDTESDSLALIATDWYGKNRQGKRAALSWYGLGCIYMTNGNSADAVDAFLTSQSLFPDTIDRTYAIVEQNLGSLYLDNRLYADAYRHLYSCLEKSLQLQDTRMAYYAKYHMGLCYLYELRYDSADSIFNTLLSEPLFSRINKRGIFLQKSKMCLVRHEYEPCLDNIEQYLAMTSDKSTAGAAYSIKGDAFMALGQSDSAYHYYRLSLDCHDELYTDYGNSLRLTQQYIQRGFSDEALKYLSIFTSLADSIKMQENAAEVQEVKSAFWKDQVTRDLRYRHRTFMFLSSSVIAILALTLFLLYNIYRKRSLKTILERTNELHEKEIELFHQMDEIQSYSIRQLEEKVRQMSLHDDESHQVLLQVYANRLAVARDQFNIQNEASTLTKYKMNSKITSGQRESILAQIKEIFNEVFKDIFYEIPGSSPDEAYTLVLSYLGCGNEMISQLLQNVSSEAIRKRKYRLKKEFPEFCALFC